MVDFEERCGVYEVCHQGLWRNGSASDSRSEGWEFESLWPQFVLTADFLSIGAPEHDELLIIVATLEKITSDTQYLGPKCETSHQCYASPSPLDRGRPGPSVHETATEALMRRWECSDAIRLGMRTGTDGRDF